MHLGQFLGLLVLIISLYILWQIKQVILLVFAAVVLATIMNRIVQRLQKYHLKRGVAIAIAVLGLLILVVGFFAAIVPRLVEQLQQLIVLLPKISTQVQTWIDWALNLVPGRMLDRLQGIDTIAQNLQTLLNQLLNNFFVVLNNSFAAVIGLLLFVVLSVMLLANPAQYRRIFILAFPAFYRKRVDEILTKCEHSLVGWI
ncbi:MAG: AI-2E family transporter, partial [Xenococcaceae cyanobacterium]